MRANPETIAVPHLANRAAGVFQFSGLALSLTHHDAFADISPPTFHVKPNDL